MEEKDENNELKSINSNIVKISIKEIEKARSDELVDKVMQKIFKLK